MKPSTADDLAQRCEQLELVQQSQLDAVWSELGGRNVPAKDLGAALLRRELLTSYQLDRLMRGEQQGFFYGRAKILYQVGAGSFSRVYRAMHADSGRILAVKVLRSRFSSDEEKCKSFQREGEVGKLLRHPNIVAIEEVGRENNTSYITMEFVEGQTLRELVRVRGAIDLQRALGLIHQIVDGLDYAHRKGVTHRDLKASNVLISFTGEAKLVDFGLAGGDTAGSSKAVRRMGPPRTVDYAAIENIAGLKDDSVRSDIYFLGTIAYLALSGSSALVESRDRTVRADPKRFTSVEPLAARAPHLPRDVVDWVSKMMQLDPKERWQTMMEVRRSLEHLIARHSGGAAEAGTTGGAAPAAAPAPALARAAAAAAASAPAATKGTLILVATASPEQAPLREFFRKLGYKVLLTENPGRAVACCSAKPPVADCLLINVASVGEEGIDIFNSLAHDEFLRNVPAVLLVDEQRQDLAARARVDDRRKLVEVPLRTEDVSGVLESLLGSS
jgi:serine/threonine-protein kinase